jgi:predicted  nucleic acid-binding Zn-ribbon protein
MDQVENTQPSSEVETKQRNLPLSKLSRHLSTSQFSSPETPFKELYYQLKEELKESQKRLEAANYKVGQMEAEIRNFEKSMNLLQSELQSLKNTPAPIQSSPNSELKSEIKYIYLVLFLLLASQPFWFYLFQN